MNRKKIKKCIKTPQEKLQYKILTKTEKALLKDIKFNEEEELKKEVRLCDISIIRIENQLKILRNSEDLKKEELILKYTDSVIKLSRQKVRCLKMLVNIGYDEAKLQIALTKLELIFNIKEETENKEGLIKILKEVSDEVWKN